MTRVKGGTISRARHKKQLKKAKGYFGSKHRLYKTANEQVMHSGAYAYRDRKARKGDFRKLWVIRINAACRENEISYSRFIDGLNKAGVEINRKMLSEVAIDNPKAFSDFVAIAKAALEGKVKKEVKETPAKEEKVEAPKAAKKEVKEEKSDLSSMTVAELRAMAKDKEIAGYSTMKKAELVDALK